MFRRPITRALGVLALCCATMGAAPLAADAATAPTATPMTTRCSDTVPPSWFYGILSNAAKADSSIPDSWGTSYDMARIVCFESTYNTLAVNGIYHGLAQMSETSVTGVNVSWSNYLNGTATHKRAYYQLLAALRYCKARYGTPAAGWSHEVNYNWW